MDLKEARERLNREYESKMNQAEVLYQQSRESRPPARAVLKFRAEEMEKDAEALRAVLVAIEDKGG